MEFLHTMVRISDIDNSINFYCQKLGLISIPEKIMKKEDLL